MIRNILLVDDSPCMRKILRRKILANLNDSEVFEARDSEEAHRFLADQPCNLIIYSWHLADNGALPLLRELRKNPKFNHLTVLLLSHDREDHSIRTLLDAGATECLYLPISTRTLTETINRVCNPFSLRKTKRYSFGSASTYLEQKRYCFKGQVINISLGGMLCELDWFDDLQCGAPLMARVEIKVDNQVHVVENIYAKTVNLRLIESNPDHTFRRVRIALAFLHVPAEALEILDGIFRIADSEENEQENEEENVA